MGRRWPDYYAPLGRCNQCGWEGKDWAFKYQGLCSDCYKQWKKAKTAAKRALKPPNDNIEIAEGLVVTRNVRNRLDKKAQSEVLYSKRSHRADQLEGIWIFPPLIMVGMVHLLGISWPYNLILIILGFVIGITMVVKSYYMSEEETAKRRLKISARMEKLARDRQQRIDEASMFYTSPEWRLVRERVIQKQGRVCQECRRKIYDDFDLTVDHIKPRSKFPELALDFSNLRVLCRSCNSIKSDIYDESETIVN